MDDLRRAATALLELGKRDLSNPKYAAYFDDLRAALARPDRDAVLRQAVEVIRDRHLAEAKKLNEASLATPHELTAMCLRIDADRETAKANELTVALTDAGASGEVRRVVAETLRAALTEELDGDNAGCVAVDRDAVLVVLNILDGSR